MTETYHTRILREYMRQSRGVKHLTFSQMRWARAKRLLRLDRFLGRSMYGSKI